MKRGLAIVIIAVMLLASGCKANDVPAPGESAGEIEAKELNVQEKDAITDFALTLLRKTHTESGTVISPVSVIYALGVLANGADSETLSEITDTTGVGINELNGFLKSYKAGLKSTEKTSAYIANSIWTNKNEMELKKEFEDLMKAHFDAQIKSVEFSETVKEDVNNWVSENTGGKIDGALDYVSPEAVMYIINAVCFDGEWEKSFEPDSTRVRAFTKEDGSSVNVPMMSGKEDMFIFGENEKGFIKNYENGNFSFIALMPNEGETIEQYLNTLSGEKLRTLIEGRTEQGGKVVLPKIKTEGSFEMNDLLKDMGIKSMFNVKRADFSQISDSKTFVNRFLHKVYINVDENGTQAAASTMVESNQSAAEQVQQPLEFTRPFIYMITDSESRQPLFIGTYMGEGLSSTPKVQFTCGNTETKLYLGDGINEEQKIYTFEGGDSVWLSQLLADLEYSPDKLCKCLPEIKVDTEYKTGYGISLGETPYARCDEGQADLTKEQAKRIAQIIENVKSGKVF
ncbi:MAG: serpin family protein [Clostridia bacterium]|nr:serpin family protein [Clostridia bacterium]